MDNIEVNIRKKLNGIIYQPLYHRVKWNTYNLKNDKFSTVSEFRDVFNYYGKINVPGGIYNTFAYLMTQLDANSIAELINFGSFSNLKDNIGIFCDLLWYIYVSENPYKVNLTNEEINYISGLPIENLLEILGTEYYGPIDKASLLFAAISGYFMELPNYKNSRYEQVSVYSPIIVWYFARTNGFDMNDPLHYGPPYIYLASCNFKITESIANAANQNNIDSLINKYGIVLRTSVTPKNLTEKVEYFIKEISDYDYVLSRPANILPPPVIRGYGISVVENTLKFYTLKELIDAYEPIGMWFERRSLITNIYKDSTIGSEWSWRNLHCNNDDSINIIEASPHGEIDKFNRDDPTLSYGVQGNYRCYQTIELTESFREYDGIFHFRVPDWEAPNPTIGRQVIIDKTTNQPLIQDFPLESMKQLRTLLLETLDNPALMNLLAKIDYGIREYSDANRQINILKTTYYNTFNNNEQYIIKLYLAWLFTYGMWMRFWKGPGYPWPYHIKNIANEKAREQQQVCSPEDRDEHSFIQQSIRTTFIETYEKDPILLNWINSIPVFNYNFSTNYVELSQRSLTNLLNRLARGDQCMGFGADYIIQTAYYIIIKIFNFNDNAQFDNFINEMFPSIFETEKQVVDYQLNKIKNPNANNEVRQRVTILRERQKELLKPIPKQPGFIPGNVEPNVHT